MEYEVSGKVYCDKISNSRAVRRLVQKRITDWIRSHQKLIGPNGKANFDVSFMREGPGHLVYCVITLRIGSKVWKASHCTDELHRALMLCLERMIPQNSLRVAVS